MTASETAPTIEYEQATAYRRLFARLFDLLIVGLALFLLSMALATGIVRVAFRDQAVASQHVSAVWGWLFLALILAYDVLMHHLAGATVGKLLLGLRVMDIQGHRLGWGRCLLRVIVLYAVLIAVGVAIAATLSLIGWIFLRALGKYERFPHDRASRSFVVRLYKGQPRLREAGAPSPALATPLADLERLRAQGMISQEEYERKRKELGA